MRFGSVCSGIEAASIAWHELGWEAAWLAEVDVAAATVLAHRLGASAPVYPLADTEKSLLRIKWGDRLINWGDMTRLPAEVSAGNAEAPDILCGGTPCQGFSVAGLRGGLKDPRGQLTLSFVELANAIDDRRAALGQQPCAIFWENVPGVRSDTGNAFGHFLAAIVGVEDPIEPGPRPEQGRSSSHWSWKKETREHVPRWSSAGVVAGPRRTIAWRSSDAQYAGLAQRRERVFVVASAREGFDPQVVLLEFDGLRRDTAPSREDREGFTHSTAPCLTSSSRGVERTGDTCGQDPVVACLRPERSTEITPQWWDGSPISQTLDAVLHKGQTMPEKGRFPAVLQPVIPILEAGARTGASTNDIRAGMGIGDAGDPMFTLQSSKQHAVAVMPFNTTQITSPENGSNPQWGDPCFSLAAGNHPPAVAISVALRGREGGGTAELGDDVAGTLRASGGGGGDKPHVLTVHGTQNPIIGYDLAHALGRNHGQENAVCVTGNITHALKAEGFDGSEDGTGRGQPIIAFSCKDYGNDATLDLTPTMRAMNHSGSHANAGGQLAVQSEMAVRRLMPIECERLMGFPDNYTLVPVGKGMAADGPRYKQLGNSWAVPCVTWIGKRLDKHLADLDAPVVEPVAMSDDALHLWLLAA